MSKEWAFVIIFVVFMAIVWSFWEVYRAFETEEDIGQYEAYVAPISRDFDGDLLLGVYALQDKVLVKEQDIMPKE